MVKQLDVYKKSYEVSLLIHRLSLTFPKLEQYELAGQLRRASKSIPMNIAEGYAKKSSKAEFRRFLLMASGSTEEVKVQLEYSKDLGYITEVEYELYLDRYNEVGRMLYGLSNRQLN